MPVRLASAVTLLSTTAALVLTFLVLFAGNTPSFLQHGDILTLNVSRLGYGKELFNTTDGNPHNPFSAIINGLQGDINNAFDEAAADIASKLNLSDYYSVHVMNYCRGMYEPNATVAALGGSVGSNTTYCSPKSAIFHFNITGTVQNSLPSKISLSDLHWPSAITDAENTIKLASIVMSILYIIAAGIVGLALLVALFGVLSRGGGGRFNACIDLMVSILAFLALFIASAVSTAIMLKAVKELNKYGQDLGIHATKGNTFLGMTWTATGLMLFSALASIWHFIRGRESNYISHKA